MEPILAQALGAEGARRALEDMLAMMKGLHPRLPGGPQPQGAPQGL